MRILRWHRPAKDVGRLPQVRRQGEDCAVSGEQQLANLKAACEGRLRPVDLCDLRWLLGEYERLRQFARRVKELEAERDALERELLARNES